MASIAVEPPGILTMVGEPHRWRILSELSRSDRRVGELIDLVGAPQNLVSYHLGELRRAGLVTARRSSADARDVYYRADLHRCRDLLAAAGGDLHPGLVLTPPLAPTLPARARRPRVLFLCTGNSARSQIAEALLIERSAHRIDARSAGSNPKPLHSEATRVMAERGLDISRNRSKHLRAFTGRRFDRVITLCDKVREVCPEFPGVSTRAHWSIPDPAAPSSPSTAFDDVADDLARRVDLLIAELSGRSTERNPHVR